MHTFVFKTVTKTFICAWRAFWSATVGGELEAAFWPLYDPKVFFTADAAALGFSKRRWKDPPGWLAKSSTVDRPIPSDKLWNSSEQLQEARQVAVEDEAALRSFPVSSAEHIHYFIISSLQHFFYWGHKTTAALLEFENQFRSVSKGKRLVAIPAVTLDEGPTGFPLWFVFYK